MPKGKKEGKILKKLNGFSRFFKKIKNTPLIYFWLYIISPQLGGGQDFRSNSFGGQVMPTISACEYKMGQKQKDTTGGYVMHMFRHVGGCGRSTLNSMTPVNGSVWGV